MTLDRRQPSALLSTTPQRSESYARSARTSPSLPLLFRIFPDAILGVIIFFAGAELALTARDIGDRKNDFYVMLIVAGFAMWNMGVAFLVGVIVDTAVRKGWIKI